MFKLYQPGTSASDVTSSRLLSQQRAWLGDKMFPQGCYHDLLSRSLYYFPQPSQILPFRPPTAGHAHGHFRHDLHGNGRIQEGITPYLPFDARLFTNKSILYDTLKTKLSEEGKQPAEVNTDAMTSPSAYSNVGNVETLVTSSSASEAKKSFTCPQCKYSTDRKNNLKRHVITMHFDCDRKLECCGTIFRSKAKLREHVTLFHKNGYRCLVCARMFCRKALLRRHMAVHSGKKDFHCEFCSYATSHKSNLERHQKVHAKSARFIYSHRKPVTPFERRFCAINTIGELERDVANAVKDEFNLQESQEIEKSDDLKLNEEEENKLMDEDELIDMSDNEAVDTIGAVGEDNRDVFGNQHDQFDKSGDDRKDREFTYEQCKEINVGKIHTIHYLFQPYAQNIGRDTASRKTPEMTENIRQADRDSEEHKQSSADDQRIADKENVEDMECDTAAEAQAGGEVRKTHPKLLPRLCGLPYRCAGCGGRFESQDKYNHHRCQPADSCGKTVTEKSVSLVAMILKQGKTCTL